MIIQSPYGTLRVWTGSVQIPLVESLEWMTDNFQSRNGLDYFSRMRNAPRQFFTLTTQVKPDIRSKLLHLFQDALSNKWAIPDWREFQRVTLSAGATSVEVNGDYPGEGLAILWKNFGNVEIVEFTRSGSVLNFSESLSGTWTNAFIMPLRIGRVIPTPSFRTVDSLTIFQFKFQSDYNDNTLEEETDYELVEKFKDIDFYDVCPLYSGTSGIRDNIVQKEEIFDSYTGLVDSYSPWLCSRQSRSFETVQHSKEELLELLRWLYRRAGSYRPFFTPSWTKDFTVLSTGLVENTIDVEFSNYSSCHRNVSIRLKTGVWLNREISSIENIGGGALRFTLNSPLNIQRSDIERMSYLRSYVLDSDKVDIRHLGNYESECTLKIKEIREYHGNS